MVAGTLDFNLFTVTPAADIDDVMASFDWVSDVTAVSVGFLEGTSFTADLETPTLKVPLKYICANNTYVQ